MVAEPRQGKVSPLDGEKPTIQFINRLCSRGPAADCAEVAFAVDGSLFLIKIRVIPALGRRRHGPAPKGSPRS